MTLEGIVDKIVPTLIVVVIMALFGMYMRIGYLEQTAKMSIERYNQDMHELKTEIRDLQEKVTANKDNVLILKTKNEIEKQ